MKIEKGKKYRCELSKTFSSSHQSFIKGKIYLSHRDGHLVDEQDYSRPIELETAHCYFSLMEDEGARFVPGKWYIPYSDIKLFGKKHFVQGKSYLLQDDNTFCSDLRVCFSVVPTDKPGVIYPKRWLQYFHEEFLPENWAVKVDEIEVAEFAYESTGVPRFVDGGYFVWPQKRVEIGLPQKYHLLSFDQFKRLVLNKQKSEFVLPEKWAVRRRPDNYEEINAWANNTTDLGFPYQNKNGYIHSRAVDTTLTPLSSPHREPGFTEITFDQFKEFVLGKAEAQPAPGSSIFDIPQVMEGVASPKIYILQKDLPDADKGTELTYKEAEAFGLGVDHYYAYRSKCGREALYVPEMVENNPDWFLPKAEVEKKEFTESDLADFVEYSRKSGGSWEYDLKTWVKNHREKNANN